VAGEEKPMIAQKPFVIISIMILLACSPLQTPKAGMSANPAVEVKGDRIYRNGEIFAELRYLFPSPARDKFRGLAIYYYPSERETWIYPEGGWQIRGGDKPRYTVREIEEAKANRKAILREGKPLSKEQAIAGLCFEIKISEDGRTVSYTTYTTFRMFSESLSRKSGQYLVEYGEGANREQFGGRP
jgi:hypothetical protein